MKKLVVIVLLLTACYGCVTETWTATPYRTLYANDYMYIQFDRSLRDISFYMRMCILADRWANAADDYQREQIEDSYMSQYKLRMHGDTITVMGDDRKCTVITADSKLNDEGAEWLVGCDRDMFAVKRTGDCVWHLTAVTDKFAELSPALDVTLLEQDDVTFDFSIAGSCSSHIGESITRLPDILYTIGNDAPVCVRVLASLDGYVRRTYKGSVDIEELGTENRYHAQVRFNENGGYDITYRGYTERYQQLYYE